MFYFTLHKIPLKLDGTRRMRIFCRAKKKNTVGVICILPEIGTMVEYSSAIDKAKGLVWRNDE